MDLSDKFGAASAAEPAGNLAHSPTMRTKCADSGGPQWPTFQAEAATPVREYRHATACHGPAEAANPTVPVAEILAVA